MYKVIEWRKRAEAESGLSVRPIIEKPRTCRRWKGREEGFGHYDPSSSSITEERREYRKDEKKVESEV